MRVAISPPPTSPECPTWKQTNTDRGQASPKASYPRLEMRRHVESPGVVASTCGRGYCPPPPPARGRPGGPAFGPATETSSRLSRKSRIVGDGSTQGVVDGYHDLGREELCGLRRDTLGPIELGADGSGGGEAGEAGFQGREIAQSIHSRSCGSSCL